MKKELPGRHVKHVNYADHGSSGDLEKKYSERSIEMNAEILTGGLMNTPRKVDNMVYRKVTRSTETIHHLLKHVRSKGIYWVPEPISFDADTEIVSYLKGEVPHAMPEWIWSRGVLSEVAIHMRDLHDLPLLILSLNMLSGASIPVLNTR